MNSCLISPIWVSKTLCFYKAGQLRFPTVYKIKFEGQA